MSTVHIAGDAVGSGHPAYICAEIGLNHNGDVKTAMKLIDCAVETGCDAVKFQKRTPELSTPKDQWRRMRQTPWGDLSYIDYRHAVELSREDYERIDEHCRRRGIAWFASCWDEEAVAFIESFEPPAYKIASAGLTDTVMHRAVLQTARPIILSTGMSTLAQIDTAVSRLSESPLVILHATSSYPCRPEELNLRMINTLQDRFAHPIGYSGHEPGLQASLAAVALGANFVERHITLDRTMWGSDQAASLEPIGLARLVRDIRVIETALGDGIKRVYESEMSAAAKLRRFP